MEDGGEEVGADPGNNAAGSSSGAVGKPPDSLGAPVGRVRLGARASANQTEIYSCQNDAYSE